VTDGRKRSTALASLLIAVGFLGLHAATPAAAEPDIDTVKQRVDRLYEQAEKASERYNAAKEQLKASEVRLKALNADVSRQRRVVDDMRGDVATMVVDQYQGEGLSTASQVVFSNDAESFLDNLNAISSYNSQRGQVVREYGVQLRQLKLRKSAADDQVAALTKTRAVLKDEKAKIDDRAAKAKALLGKLKEKQRLELLRRQRAAAAAAAQAAPPAPAPVATAAPATGVPAVSSGRAGAAVRYAMAQVGDAYVWGATGPSAYDCSGLTMMAWAQAGVGLPHSSTGQQGSGRSVSESELQPGDLVFYYSPVHHVGMYIGNGMIVHAANPSSGVQVAGLHSMPYMGATRPG
jgi:peptidoglycan DL-endopeptidase CwlO